MIEGLEQEIKYESSVHNIYTQIRQSGQLVNPDSAPTVSIYNSSGSSLVSATAMTMVPVNIKGGRAMLDFDAQTAAFQEGALLTGGTSGATAYIERIIDSGTTGTLYLRNVFGTFANNETISDSGDSSGSATANLAPYTCEYYYTVDASSTTNYPLGSNFYGVVTFIINSVTDTKNEYFAVVKHPFTQPLVTDSHIRSLHPDWAQMHPDGESATFVDQIEVAHAELSRRIHALGNRAAFVVIPGQLLPYERAFAEAEIARRLTSMDPDQRDYWVSQAEALWASKGEFTWDSDDTDAVDSDAKVFSSRFTR
jgi:hypothetical protein